MQVLHHIYSSKMPAGKITSFAWYKMVELSYVRELAVDVRSSCWRKAGSVQYAVGEKVRLWVNKVGPYNNPQETYNYYYLPFCAPPSEQKPMHKWGGLGEVLGGNQLIDSQLDIKYRGAPF